MKKALLILFMVGMASSHLTAEDIKFAYVDVEEVFNNYSVTKDNDAKLKAEGLAKADERDGLVETIKKLKEESELLSESVRREKEVEIEDMIKDLRGFDEKTKAELRGKRDLLLKNIFNKIKETIEIRGKKDGYTFIFNDRALLYKTDAHNLTEQIVDDLNAKVEPKGE